MSLTKAICKSANHIYLAAQFSTSSDCPEATRRTVYKAVRTGRDLLNHIEPCWLRTTYSAVASKVTADMTADPAFQATVGDLLQTVGVNQIPLARLGSSLCAWDGTCVPFSQLGDALDTLDTMVNREEESVAALLREQSANETTLLTFSDMFYGVAVIVAAINSPTEELRGFQREITSAAAKLVLDSSMRLSHIGLHGNSVSLSEVR